MHGEGSGKEKDGSDFLTQRLVDNGKKNAKENSRIDTGVVRGPEAAEARATRGPKGAPT